MVCMVARLSPRPQASVRIRRQQVRRIGSSPLSEFIIPKTSRRSIKPLPLPAELNEPGMSTLACNLDKPSRVKSSHIETSPAFYKWFQTKGSAASQSLLKTNLFKEEGGSSLVPLEYLGVDPSTGSFTFKRFQAPLATFASFVEAPSKNFNLYLGQCDFTSFPKRLQKDLDFLPRFLRKYSSDRRVYGRNIWIGTPPTYTPLHRDPNHNYFHQLAGSKKVRIMSPDTGLKVYSKHVGDEGDPRGRIRTEEMMVSSQRQDLYRAVWENQDPNIEIFEGDILRGQSLFIPEGWWHSFKSEDINSISASVSTSVALQKFELLHDTDEWSQVNYWFQFDTQAKSALRELAARQHMCVELMAGITRTKNISLNAQLVQMNSFEDKQGLERGSILGDRYWEVLKAQEDFSRKKRAWGYRGRRSEELQSLLKRGGAGAARVATWLAHIRYQQGR